jgi:hypothetical protein
METNVGFCPGFALPSLSSGFIIPRNHIQVLVVICERRFVPFLAGHGHDPGRNPMGDDFKPVVKDMSRCGGGC